MRYLRTEAEIVDVKLGVHTLQSKIVCLRAILACAIEGTALLFVASDEATKK
jgi:hypothetical protein